MEPKYYDDNLTSDNFKSFEQLVSTIQIKTKERKRGGLNEITDLRTQIATLLDRSFGQVSKLTKNWSATELRDTLKTANSFINPPALFWKLYKEKKHIYGKKKKITKEEKQARLF